jgi:hypothetical protein
MEGATRRKKKARRVATVNDIASIGEQLAVLF